MADQAEPRFVAAADGVKIAVHALTAEGGGGAYRGAGEPLLVAHATGFHGRSYQPLADSLTGAFRSEAIDERGHGLSGLPPDLDFDWNGFGLDVLAGVSVFGSEPVFGFGHSAGGTALVLAELARPGTFRAIYCFEPIIFPVDELLPRMPDGPLSVAARRRREVFDSRQAAFENYRSKPPLSALGEASLRAYVEHGFEDLPDGTVRLRCRRGNEAEVYAAGPALDICRQLGAVTCPVVLAGGADTDAIGPEHLELLADRLPASEVEMFEEMGHFGPLEDHHRVARSVIERLLR